MTSAITDFNQYAGLRVGAEKNDPAVLREVAGQFEALFIQSMLKNMREASLGDPLFGDSEQHAMYEEMLDQQMAVEMASGKGIGLAELLVRQLGASADNNVSDRGERAFPLSRNNSGERSLPLSGNTGADRAFPLSGINNDERALPLPGKAHGERAFDLPERAPSMGSQALWSDPKSFAEDIWPHVKRIAGKLNVAPEGILAQVALETGWGSHVPERGDGASSFNLFGIKSGRSWSGDSVTKPTLEFEAGVARPEVAKFRAYDNVAATFDDYSNLMAENPRYASVSNHGDNIDGFADALQSSGYATDPNYADKIRSVVHGKTMQSFLSDL